MRPVANRFHRFEEIPGRAGQTIQRCWQIVPAHAAAPPKGAVEVAELDREPQVKLGWKVVQMVEGGPMSAAAASSARCRPTMSSERLPSSISASPGPNSPDARRKRPPAAGKPSRRRYWRRSRPCSAAKDPLTERPPSNAEVGEKQNLGNAEVYGCRGSHLRRSWTYEPLTPRRLSALREWIFCTRLSRPTVKQQDFLGAQGAVVETDVVDQLRPFHWFTELSAAPIRLCCA